MAQECPVVSDLVFDIGVNNGDDSAYYLHLGFRVIGIEADPDLAATCTKRFESEVRAGRMKVVNAGILKEQGVFTFYRSLQESGWSTFDPEKCGKPGEWEEVSVPCITTQQLIQEHGRPYFMKVDIEGADIETLAPLTPSTAPAYVSLELNCTDPIVERLIELGYSDFKFVNGETYWHNPPILHHEIGWRLLRKTGRVLPLVRSAVSKLPERFRAKGEWDPAELFSPDGY